jgi:hypothetical protein
MPVGKVPENLLYVTVTVNVSATRESRSTCSRNFRWNYCEIEWGAGERFWFTWLSDSRYFRLLILIFFGPYIQFFPY